MRGALLAWLPVLCAGAGCLPDAIPPAERVLLELGGKQVPVGFWVFNWPSAWLANRVVKILTEEVIGFNASISGVAESTLPGVYATAGCANPKAYLVDNLSSAEGPQCGPQPDYIHHVALEVWGLDKLEKVRTRLAAMPQVVPLNLGTIGYDGVEGMYAFAEQRAHAYQAEGLFLEYYRSYNASRNAPQAYFDRYSMLDPAGFLPCGRTLLMDTTQMGNYLNVTGDVEGVVRSSDGRYVGRCWENSWWFAPACRSAPEQCIPFVTGGSGWYLQATMQKATAFNMPLAVAVARDRDQYERFGNELRVMVYWWEPQNTFMEKAPAMVIFPSADLEARARGIWTSQFADEWLGKIVSNVLQTASPSLHGFLSKVSITGRHMQAMFHEANAEGCTIKDPTCFEGIACEWLQSNRNLWERWVVTACSAGLGPLDNLGHFIEAELQGAGRGNRCALCQPGCFSESISTKEPANMCSQCPAGRSTNTIGATACASCPAGRHSGPNTTHVCRTFGTPGPEPCQACAPGRYSQATGSALCDACAPGRFQYSGGQTQCAECGRGRRADAGSVSCDPCYACMSNTWLMFELAAFFVILVAALQPLLLAFGHPLRPGYRIRIHDLTCYGAAEEGVVIKCGDHWIRGQAKLPIRLSGTGHPVLDCPKNQWRARAVARDRLQLLDSKGAPIRDADLQASVGCMTFPWYVALLRMALFGERRLALPLVLPPLLIVLALLLIDADPVQAPTLDPLAVKSEAWLVRLAFLTEVAIGVPFAICLRLARLRPAFTATPLEQLLQTFGNKLREANPRPGRCERGEGRAVELRDLVTFYEHFRPFIRARNMYYVVNSIMLPLTKPHQLSYAEVVGPKVVTWFVSHFWGTSFHGFITSLGKHAEEGHGLTGLVTSTVMGARPPVLNFADETYWVCSFSNNQWLLEEELGEGIKNSSFYMCLRSGHCRGTVMVLDASARPLRRSWCLFEMLQTKLLTDLQEGFTGLWLCTESGTLNSGNASAEMAVRICNVVAQLRLEDAQATRPQDKEMIDAEVASMPGGFPQMNAFLRGSLHDALLGMKAAFNKDFDVSMAKLLPEVPDDATMVSLQHRLSRVPVAHHWAGTRCDQDLGLVVLSTKVKMTI